jgi:transporter family protein
VVKLIGTALIAVGVFMMIEKKDVSLQENKKGWMVYAVLSAVFAAATSILAKVGITGVESNLGTAIRTGVVLVLAWAIVFGKGKHTQLRLVDKKELIFICLSGIATGASWLCYYYAIQNGVVSVVVPIDKMSILITVAFSYIFLKEKLTKKQYLFIGIIIVGILILAVLEGE